MANDTFSGIAGKVLPLHPRTDAPVKGSRTARRPYVQGSLDLSDSAAAWLAAIIDGEGSICINCRKSPAGGKRIISVTICYNTDWGVIEKAARLIPWANVRLKQPSGFSRGSQTVAVYEVATAQRGLIFDLLTRILPDLAHSRKIAKAREILAYTSCLRERRKSRG